MSARTDGRDEMYQAYSLVVLVQQLLQRTEVREKGKGVVTARVSTALRPVRCIVEQAVRVLNGDIASVRWFEDGGEMVLRVMVRRA